MAYTDRFYAKRDVKPSAMAVLARVLELAPAASLCDIGCGDGGWLAAAQSLGVQEIAGVDGPWVPEARRRIPQAAFTASPLTEALPLRRRFDVAMSLEVAEHLPAERAPSFIAELCALADLVVFSAAVPGQGGTGHVNEQWPEYWAALFAAQGFSAIDGLRQQLWNEAQVRWWYRQNLLLFAKPEALARWPKLAALAQRCPGPPLALVHPQLYAKRRGLARCFAPRALPAQEG